MMIKLRRSYLVLISLLVILGVLVKIYLSWLNFLEQPLIPQNTNVVYLIQPGISIKKLAQDLNKDGYLKHPYYFILLGYLTNTASYLRVGEYEFKGGTTPYQLLKQIVNGEVVRHKITFIEGWSFQQIINALKNSPKLHHTLQNSDLQEICALINMHCSNPEGLFFPDTYIYTYATFDVAILKASYHKMQQVLTKEWQGRQLGLPYKTPYEALIVASLIEKEAKKPQDRPQISAVILNRLHKHMYLQIDPTVIYGLGSLYQGTLTAADLKFDSPYNTYLHKGLPPTPIAMPSKASIHAALNPSKENYLYFVAKGDGSHFFSDTLKEHHRAVKIYRSMNNSQKQILGSKFFWCDFLGKQLNFLCQRELADEK